MNLRLALISVVAVSMAAPSLLSAQTVSAEITFKVPVNLTQLGPDVQKVKVSISIVSDAIIASTSGVVMTGDGKPYLLQSAETPVTGGQVATTVPVVFSVSGLNNPTGKTATVTCVLLGWSVSQQQWLFFNTGAANTSFRTTTDAKELYSSFVWQ